MPLKDKRPDHDPTVMVCISLSRSELEKIDVRVAHHNVRNRSEYLVAKALGRPLELRDEREVRVFELRRKGAHEAHLRSIRRRQEAQQKKEAAGS